MATNMFSSEAIPYYQALVDIGRYESYRLLFGYSNSDVPTWAVNSTLTLFLVMASAFQYPTCPLEIPVLCQQYTKIALVYRSTMPSIQLG